MCQFLVSFGFMVQGLFGESLFVWYIKRMERVVSTPIKKRSKLALIFAEQLQHFDLMLLFGRKVLK